MVAGLVEVGAEVVVTGVAVVEQVPDDGEDGVAGGDDGAQFAAASGQASVAFAEECVAAGQDGGDFAECAGEPGVAFARGGGFVFPGGLVGAWCEPGPGRQMRGGREHGHVHAEFGDEFLGAGDADPGDLIELADLSFIGTDRGFDRGAHLGDVGGHGVDAVEHLGAQQRVVVLEMAGQRLTELTDLRTEPAAGQFSQDLGVALPGDQRSQDGPAGDPEHVRGHYGEFDLRVLEEFLQTLLLPGPVPDQGTAVAGEVPQRDALLSRREPPWWASLPPGMASVRELARAGLKIQAVKMYREVTGADLPTSVRDMEAMAADASSAADAADAHQ